MHCGNFQRRPQTRRQMLARCANGFGAVAMASLSADWVRASSSKPPHHAPRAKSVIFLYMDGGPSQVDTFDPKPMLEKYHGQDPHQAIGNLQPTQFNQVGKVMKSPWRFRKYGQSGIEVSDLFPHVAQHVDELAVIRSMTSKFSEHTSANYFLHTGNGFQGRPSMGAWVGYGLGSLNQDLPGFIVVNGGLIPPGGLDNFNSGFLPASYQASVFAASDVPVANIERREPSDAAQVQKLDLIESLDRHFVESVGGDDQLESAIANYETAYRMQSAVPDLMNITSETLKTQQMYGLDSQWAGTATFGRQCLVARRLVERGVRFIELTCPGGSGDRWDQHGNLVDGHTKNCRTVDQPIAALLTDLKQRGLLESTLVIWMGEFGRTPFAQGDNGRDHNPFGFSLWMAGGGVRGGVTVGATDDWGYHAIEDRFEIHDLHATMLHLLGLDHKRSTFRFSARDMRLTDVHGHLIHQVLA